MLRVKQEISNSRRNANDHVSLVVLIDGLRSEVLDELIRCHCESILESSI